jgi:deazaflavin-dependent oxidoreductase (nitroreductase family)
MAASEPSFRRRRASPWLRAMLKVPSLVYRGPLAELMRSRCVLLLTTRGRKTGRPRTGAVSFMPLEDHFVVFSGWGVGSNWFKNIRVHPEVTVRVGRKQMRATAQVVEDPERRRALMLQMQARSRGCGPPRLIRPVLKLMHVFDYDGEIEMAVAAGGTLPVVEIFPQTA